MSVQPESFDKRTVLREALRAVKDMQAQLEAAERARTEPIAIIGMGCRFPGGANSPEAYWRLLAQGGDAITEVPASRWSPDDYAVLDPDGARARAVQYGGFVEPIDRFDPHFFGIAPREAASLDPQHRLVLEVCWEALEDACQSPDRLRGSLTGVFVGITSSDYATHLRETDASPRDIYFASGNIHNSAAGRVSYLFGLHGPSMAIDTACSASLSAIHLACQSLRLGESDLALAGGVNCLLTPEPFVWFTKAGMLARDGRCKSFDAAADGLVRAEGCGMIVLKRLSDARANNDRILALIRGSAVNQDGPSSGLTVPNGPAQQAVIRKALGAARIRPADVQYVEAHGTGTSLGDPIELEALDAALSEGRPRGQRLIVGAVKTNLGHLEAASGVAGLMKIVLALQHESIPGNLHFSRLSPAITLRHLDVHVPTENVPWKRGEIRRLAGVSSFGFSGTNAHVVIEEAPAVTRGDVPTGRQLIVASAKTPSALTRLATRWHERVTDSSDLVLADVARASTAGRAHFAHRAAMLAETPAELASQLQAVAAGAAAANVRIGAADPDRPAVAFLFTGQGSQYPGMGEELYRTQPAFRAALDECDALLRGELGRPLLDVIYSSDTAAINQTAFTQPALFALEHALCQLWRSWGIEPAAVLGHSVGEYVAACAAGVFSLSDALRLIAARGRLMQALPAGGAMAAVFADEARVRAAIAASPQVDVAAVNGPASVVVAGPAAALQALCAALQRNGVSSQPLVVSHAFHSALMEPMLAEFRRVASDIRFEAPRLPFVSNVTGDIVAAGTRLDADYWVQHVRATVRFADGLRALHQSGCRTFLEVGPTPTLITMGQRVIPGGDARWLHSLRRGRGDKGELLASLADLYVAGAEINWHEVHKGSSATGVSLPAYPFERDRYWIDRTANEPGQRPAAAPADAEIHPLLGHRVRAAVRSTIYERRLSRSQPAFLGEHVVAGEPVFPATGFIEMAASAARVFAGGRPWRLEDLVISTPLVLADEPAVVQTVLTQDESGASIEIVSARDGASHEWATHVSTRVGLSGSSPDHSDILLPEIQARVGEACPVDAFYDEHRARGIEFGPIFRGVRQLWRGAGESLARIAAVADQDGFLVHPATFDACLQILGVGVPPGDAAEALYLPVGVGEIHFANTGEVAWSYVRVRPGDDPARDGLSADVTLMDANGGVLVSLREVRLRRASADAVRQAVQRRTDAWLYDVGWLEMPPTDGSTEIAPGTWIVLAGASSSAFVGDLVAALAAIGQRAEVIEHGADVASLWEQMPSLSPPVRGFIPLATLDGGAAERAAVTASTQPLLQLAQHLLDRGVGETTIAVFTQGAQQVHGEDVNPSQAPAWSLARTIAIEHPQIGCRCIDLDSLDQSAWQRAVKLMASGGRETAFAVRGDRVFVARLRPSELRAGAQGGSVALEIPKRGVLDHLELQPAPRRQPGRGEVEVQVTHAGLNFRDVLNALGMYPGEAGPLGAECAGMVTAVGAGVTHVRVGDEVMGMVGGSLRSYVTTEAALVAPRPQSIGAEAAASLPVAFLTAEYALTHLAKLQRGDRVLIHAGAGGVGLAAIQVAQRAGAEIFATAGSPEKRAYLAALGVPHVLDSRTLAFADAIRERTAGRGVDVVLNSLAGDFITRSVSILADRGRFVEIGKKDIWSAAEMAAVRPDVQYFPLYLGHVDSSVIQSMLRQLAHDIDGGTLTPLPVRTYPLAEAAAGFRFMAQARHIGKIVFRCGNAAPPAPVRGDAGYLITGGLGALGLASAEWLAARGAKHLTLVGRSGPSIHAAAAIAKLESSGVEVRIVSADLGRAGDVERLFAAIDVGPPLRGVIHAAGVVADGTIEHLTWERFSSVFGPKVDGTWALHQHTRQRQLDFFVLFSSASALIPTPGQANYAAANSYLDGVARHRRASGLPAVSINWGPWAEGGMASKVDAQSRAKWERFGLGIISRQQGAELLDRLAAAPIAQVGVLPMEWHRFVAALPDGSVPAFITDVVAPATTAASGAAGPSTPRLIAQLAGAPVNSRALIVQNYVRDTVRSVLGVASSHPLELSQGLREMGMDSLMAVELRNHLQSGVGRPLPSTIAFEHPTIGALAAHLAALVDAERPPHDHDDPAVDAPSDAAADLLELSEADAEALLAEELKK